MRILLFNLKTHLPSWFLEAVSHFYQACRGQENEEIHRRQPVYFITNMSPSHPSNNMGTHADVTVYILPHYHTTLLNERHHAK